MSAVRALDFIAGVAVASACVTVVMPVLRESRHQQQIQESLTKLKKLHQAVLLYQVDNELEGTAAKALPSQAVVYNTLLGLRKSAFISPCGRKPDILPNVRGLSYSYWNVGADDYFDEYGENAVLFSDGDCNPNGQVWRSPYLKKRGLGVLLSGSVVNWFKAGDQGEPSWWSQPKRAKKTEDNHRD